MPGGNPDETVLSCGGIEEESHARRRIRQPVPVHGKRFELGFAADRLAGDHPGKHKHPHPVSHGIVSRQSRPWKANLIDVCTANEPRPTNGRPEYRAKRLTGRVIFPANSNSSLGRTCPLWHGIHQTATSATAAPVPRWASAAHLAPSRSKERPRSTGHGEASSLCPHATKRQSGCRFRVVRLARVHLVRECGNR